MPNLVKAVTAAGMSSRHAASLEDLDFSFMLKRSLAPSGIIDFLELT